MRSWPFLLPLVLKRTNSTISTGFVTGRKAKFSLLYHVNLFGKVIISVVNKNSDYFSESERRMKTLYSLITDTSLLIIANLEKEVITKKIFSALDYEGGFKALY